MNIVWGLVLTGVFGVFCRLIQVVNAVAHSPASRWELGESEADVDRAFFVDTHAEAGGGMTWSKS